VEGGHLVTAVDRPVIECLDVHLSRGARQVLRGVSFQMRCGEVVALMGSSGAGKTTILRAIAGLDPIDRGEIAVGGVRVSGGTGQDFRQLRAKSAMVFQFHCLFEHLSAAQNVWLAPVHVQRVPRAEAVQRATALLRSLGVEHRAGALPRRRCCSWTSRLPRWTPGAGPSWQGWSDRWSIATVLWWLPPTTRSSPAASPPVCSACTKGPSSSAGSERS
jgi:hypothetical protein